MFRRFARWHVWLGWLVGLPILMWTLTGLFMVSRPIEDVRGTILRIEEKPQALAFAGAPSEAGPVREMRLFMQRGRAVSMVTLLDGSTRRYDAVNGEAIAPVDAAGAREIAAASIKGGDTVARVTLFEAAEAPIDFRKPVAAWRVELRDGTYVYIGRDSGEVEAVRTRWWRAFDVMWGLHIMDLQAREDTSHPVLILFAALSAFGALLGCILMFGRRKPVTAR